MPAPTWNLIQTDNFGRADGTTIGNNWIKNDGTFTLSGGTLALSSGGAAYATSWLARPANGLPAAVGVGTNEGSLNQKHVFDVRPISGVFGLGARHDTSNGNRYLFHFTAGSPIGVQCFSLLGTAYTGITFPAPSAYSYNGTDRLRFTVEVYGASPTTLTITIYNVTTSTQLYTGTATDSASQLQSPSQSSYSISANATVSATGYAYSNYTDLAATTTLTGGTISLNGTVGATTIPLIATAVSGGASPYTEEWSISPSGAGTFTPIASSNALAITASGLSPATAYDFKCKTTDSSATPATSTTPIFTATTAFAANDTHADYSPVLWRTNGTTLSTIRNAATYRFGFTGTSAALSIDPTRTAANATHFSVFVTVDSGTRTQVGSGSLTSKFTLATGLASGNHDVKIEVANLDQNIDTWTAEAFSFTILGIILDPGAAVIAPPASFANAMLFCGDSITVGTNASPTYDNRFTYAPAVAASLLCRHEVIAYAGIGYNSSGGGNVPTFSSASGPLAYYSAGNAIPSYVARYAYAMVVLGTNDRALDVSGVSASTLSLLRGKLGSNTILFVCIPFGGSFNGTSTLRTTIVNGFTTAFGATTPVTLSNGVIYRKSSDGKSILIDVSPLTEKTGTNGTAGEWGDGLHPLGFGHTRAAVALMSAIDAATATATTGGGFRSISLNGGF